MKTKARTLAGFMELSPEKQIVFNQMEAKIRSVFERNGLTPTDTPILEYSEVLLAKAGGETEKRIFLANNFIKRKPLSVVYLLCKVLSSWTFYFGALLC